MQYGAAKTTWRACHFFEVLSLLLKWFVCSVIGYEERFIELICRTIDPFTTMTEKLIYQCIGLTPGLSSGTVY